MRIYLAGKVDKNGAWRDEILGENHTWIDGRWRSSPRWEVVQDAAVWDGDYSLVWPAIGDVKVLEHHHYTGPYRVTSATERESKSEGYFHGSTSYGQHGVPDPEPAEQIVRQCVSRIFASDLMFAYINRPDCFGTLAEIGFASAIGIPIFLVIANDGARWGWSNYWFVDNMPGVNARQAWGKSPSDLLKDAIVWAASIERPSSQAPVPADRAVRSLTQIAQWTSDPRARQVARSEVKRILGGA